MRTEEASRPDLATIRLDALTKAYGNKGPLAVRNVDLTVVAGEFLTLLGPSGSGKTTTLMMIAGFETPSSGRITIGGMDCTGLPPYRRNLSMVFQNYALFPHRSVARNVAFPLEMRGRNRSDIERAVANALSMVRLSGYEDRIPTQLSGGQQQRVALARAIGFGPSVLLMDEPLGALDKNLREQMQTEIKEIQQRLGMTVIYVTHDQQEALTMSDRIAIMNNGAIEQIDSPERMYRTPRNRFVAGFLGASNFIEATVGDVTAGSRLAANAESGLKFDVVDPGGLSRGDKIVAAIRPERVEVVTLAPEHRQDPNRNIGHVSQIVFTGDSLIYKISIGPHQLEAKLPNHDRSPKPPVGDQVEVRWGIDDIVILAD